MVRWWLIESWSNITSLSARNHIWVLWFPINILILFCFTFLLVLILLVILVARLIGWMMSIILLASTLCIYMIMITWWIIIDNIIRIYVRIILMINWFINNFIIIFCILVIILHILITISWCVSIWWWLFNLWLLDYFIGYLVLDDNNWGLSVLVLLLILYLLLFWLGFNLRSFCRSRIWSCILIFIRIFSLRTLLFLIFKCLAAIC